MSRCLGKESYGRQCREPAVYMVLTGPSFFTVCTAHASTAALGALRNGTEASVIALASKRPVVIVWPKIVGERHFGKGDTGRSLF